MDQYLRALRRVFLEDTSPPERRGKYFKGMARGMGKGKTSHIVAKGDTKGGYHPDVEAAKPDWLISFKKKVEAAPGTRFYLHARQAGQFADYYGMDLMRVVQGDSAFANSRDTIAIQYDPDKNLFYLINDESVSS